MGTLPRAATSPELAKLRSSNQSSRLYLTVQSPATVYTARLAALPASNDNVSSITYNSGSGSYTDVKAEMTMYVGSVAGAYDLGMVRIRKTAGLGATSGTINIGLTSEIPWAANCYLTIVDAFDLWPRVPYGDNMDYDIAYSDQHVKCASIPVFPRYSVRWLPAGTPNVTVIKDGSQSWPLNNTISSYAWTAPGNFSISGDTTNTVTIVYNHINASAGYRVQLDITNSDGGVSTGYGRVFVLSSESDAITQFRVDRIEGSYLNGGWSAQITMYGQADRATIRDRALCILHRRDWYGPATSDEGSLGYITGDENIELVGWIAGDSIKWASHWAGEGAVTFTIYGPQFWLNKLTMPTVGLKNIASHPPTNWKRFTNLTAKVATWHVLYWRTNAPTLIDVFPVDNSVMALQLQSGGAQTVWAQINNILNDFLIAKACCDAYGRLFMQVEQNLLPATTRSSIPTVMTVTTQDAMNAIDFERREVNDVAEIDFSGEQYDGHTSTTLYALCPGRTFSARGSSVFVRDRLAIPDQTTINDLAGAAYGWKNSPYPKWKYQLASNMHLIDLASYQYLATDIVSADTPRGITASNLRLIPRIIRRVFANNIMLTECDVEAETPIGLGLTGDTPPAPPVISVTPPPIPPVPPPPIPILPGDANEAWIFPSGYFVAFSSDFRSGGSPTWNKITLPPTMSTLPFADITTDGQELFVNGTDTGNSNLNTLWHCTNLAAIRANPSTTPTWAALLVKNQSLTVDRGTGTLGAAGDLHNMEVRGKKIIIRWDITISGTNYGLHGIYTAGAWTFKTFTTGAPDHFPTGFAPLFAVEPTGYMSSGGISAPNTYGFRNMSGALQGAWPAGPGGGGFQANWWASLSTPNKLFFVISKRTVIGPVTTDYLIIGKHDSGVYSDLQVIYTDPAGSDALLAYPYTPRGAVSGPHVYIPDRRLTPSPIWISLDGVTFDKPTDATATWGDSGGFAIDAKYVGGGSIYWLTGYAVSGNEILRVSSDHGATWTASPGGNALAGNFWSIFPAGATAFRSFQLVFLT